MWQTLQEIFFLSKFCFTSSLFFFSIQVHSWFYFLLIFFYPVSHMKNLLFHTWKNIFSLNFFIRSASQMQKRFLKKEEKIVLWTLFCTEED